MRILQVNQINQVAYIYGDGLVQRGHHVEVYEPSLIGGRAPLPVKLALMPWRVLDMRRVVGKLNRKYFDIAHIHWASYGLPGMASRIPYIVHCHGDDVRFRLQHPLFRAMMKPVLRRAAAVLCITPDLLPVVRSVRPDAFFFPGPVDTNYYVPSETDQLDKSRPWTVLLFARLDPSKGPEVATKGIARFAWRHPEVRIQLLDWGSRRDYFKRLYGGRFDFVPRVPQKEARRLILSADVIVGQFAGGALGLSELQAMSCAKPLICSSRYDEAYPYAPPLCRASTPEEIDAHLENLYQYPETGTALGLKSRDWVIENHNYKFLAAKLEACYKSILTSS